MAGGKERKKGRQTIFFTPLDPFNSDADEAESITDTNETKKSTISNSLETWTRCSVLDSFVHSTRCWSRFWHTGSNAIITYQSVPKECVVKVVSESGKRWLFARQLTPRERPKVTLRPSWVHTRSNTASMPRETESNLQPWNFDPNASGSRTWPKEEIEQSFFSESTALPTTKLTRTSSTCKESQKRSKNLWLEKKF